ncbi:MAG: hypothetical protein WDM86_18705 [Rhizomicrobium sp.]
MRKISIAAFALLWLSGCGVFDFGPPRQSMAAVSESCRARSATELSMHGLVNGESSEARAAMFDKSYRACMGAEGYDVSPAPSVRLE